MVALSGSDDGTIIVWDMEDKNKPKKIEKLTGHKLGFYSVSWSPNGRYALLGSDDGAIIVLDMTDKNKPKKITKLTGHKLGVYSVSWSPDGRYALSGSWDKTIIVWDLRVIRNISEDEIETLKKELMKLPNKTIKVGDKDVNIGVHEYMLLDSILRYRNEQVKKGVADSHAEPFKISYPKLKDMIKSLPEILQESLINKKYIKISEVKSKI